MGGSIVTDVNTPPIFESEHLLDRVSLAVEGLIVFDFGLAIGLRRNTGRYAALGEGPAEPVCIKALVAEQ